MHCNGKCQMFKKLNKAESENKNSKNLTKLYQIEIIEVIKSTFSNLCFISFQNKQYSYFKKSIILPAFTRDIFHPPSFL